MGDKICFAHIKIVESSLLFVNIVKMQFQFIFTDTKTIYGIQTFIYDTTGLLL